MNCFPGMPCWDAYIRTIYPSGCDPCSTFIFNATQVEYRGANLSCTGIQTLDTLETALQKIDEKICSETFIAQILSAIQEDETLLNTFCNMVVTCIYNASTTTSSTTSS